jgi:hypothetical protein
MVVTVVVETVLCTGTGCRVVLFGVDISVETVPNFASKEIQKCLVQNIQQYSSIVLQILCNYYVYFAWMCVPGRIIGLACRIGTIVGGCERCCT